MPRGQPINKGFIPLDICVIFGSPALSNIDKEAMTKTELLKKAKEIADSIEAKKKEIAQCEIDIAHLQKEERQMLLEYRDENQNEVFDISSLLDLESILYTTAGGECYRVLFEDTPINHDKVEKMPLLKFLPFKEVVTVE